MDKKLQLHL